MSSKLDADFNFGQANLEAQRFGGLNDSSTQRAQFLQDTMKCSLYTLQEVTEKARNATRAAMAGGKARWRVYTVGYLAVMWDSIKWDNTGTDTISFGNDIHGAVRAQLVRKTNGQPLDIISIHVRPGVAIAGNDETKMIGKLHDVSKGISLRRKGFPTIYAGDFNTSRARGYATQRGWRAVNDATDTSDTTGSQALDHIFVTADPTIPVRGWSKVDPGGVSDHKALLAKLTLPGRPTVA